jgi:glycosyltransferase involved in cell wall biosynthesis
MQNGSPVTSAPKILFLSSTWPHGKAFGGQLRALHISRALQQMGDVTVAVVSSDANDAEAQSQTCQEFRVLPPVLPRLQPNRGIIEKLRWALDPKYLNLHGYVALARDRERIVSSLGSYNLVWLSNSRTPNILQILTLPRSHLDVDDVPSTYLRSRSRNWVAFKKRFISVIQKFILKRREMRFKRRFTTISVCSEEDRNYLGGGDRIHVIPNGFERPTSVPVPNPVTHPPRIGFIGLYSYAPNLDGVRWFLKESWPAIRQAVPGIRFRLVGTDTDGPLKPADPDVDALGCIADPAAEIATWSLMIIPIRFGAGTRVKVADAFSRKCPVVSTSLGAFGYEVKDGKQLRLADTPQAFAAACLDMIQDPLSAAAIAERAWGEFLEKWTWDVVAPRVWEAAEDCLRLSFGREPCSKRR